MAKIIINLTSKLVLFILVPLIVCILTFAILMLKDSNNPNSPFHFHPSDEKLISNFYEHEDEFDQLAKMLISENYIEVIFPDSSNCQISNQRMIKSTDSLSCANFIKIFQVLGLHWAFTKLHTGNENLWLAVSYTGLSVSGSSKGYYYSSESLQPTVIVFEDTEKAKGQEVFRHIQGNWYIFFSR